MALSAHHVPWEQQPREPCPRRDRWDRPDPACQDVHRDTRQRQPAQHAKVVGSHLADDLRREIGRVVREQALEVEAVCLVVAAGNGDVVERGRAEEVVARGLERVEPPHGSAGVARDGADHRGAELHGNGPTDKPGYEHEKDEDGERLDELVTAHHAACARNRRRPARTAGTVEPTASSWAAKSPPPIARLTQMTSRRVSGITTRATS